MAGLAAVSSKPDWSQLPTQLSPRWHERERVRKAASISLACAGGLSLLKAGFSYSHRSASTLLWVGIAVVSFELARRCLAPALKDPVVALRLRKLAGYDIENSDLTFSKFFQKYKGLLASGILQPSDVVPLTEKNIDELDYFRYMEQQTEGKGEYKKMLVQALLPDARERLRSSCRVAFALDPSKPKDETDLALLGASKDPNLAALTAKSWDEFSREYSVFQVTDPRAEVALKELFIAKAQRGETDHYRSLFNFGEEVQKSLRSTLEVFELNMLAAGIIPFSHLTWNSGWNDIASNLPKIDALLAVKLKEKLRVGYLKKLSHAELLSDELKGMRETLKLTPEKIDAARVSIQDEGDKLPYLGEDGFRAKHGAQHLNNGSLKPAQIEKIKKELREELPRDSSGDLNGVLGDLEILGLRKEILSQRWEKMSFPTIAKDATELRIFSTHCREVFAPEALKFKIIEGIKGLTIFKMITDYPTLFNDFLQPTDHCVADKTFAQLTEEQVKNVGKLERVVGESRGFGFSSPALIDMLPALLSKGLLSFNSPALRQILGDFLKEHGKKVLEFKEGDYTDSYGPRYWKTVLALYKTLFPALESTYQNASLEVQKAKKARDAAHAALTERNYQSPSRDALWTELNGQLCPQLGAQEKQLRDLENEYSLDSNIRGKEYEIKKQNDLLVALQAGLYGLPLSRDRLTKRIADLEKQTAPDKAPLIELTRELSEARKNLKAQEQTSKEQLEKDPRRIELQNALDLTSKSLETVKLAPTMIAIGEIKKKIQEINNEKGGDERLLNSHFFPIDEAGKKRALERIEGYKKELEELFPRLTAAMNAFEPFSKDYHRLSSIVGQQRREIGSYIANHGSTVALNSAREAFKKLEETHHQMMKSFEVWNARPQEIEELKRKAAAIAPEIEKYSAEISKIEKELPGLQTELNSLLSQTKERSAKIKQLKRDISELKATIEPKQFSLNNDPEVAKFNDDKKNDKQKLDADYEKCVNAQIEELRKVLIPSLA